MGKIARHDILKQFIMHYFSVTEGQATALVGVGLPLFESAANRPSDSLCAESESTCEIFLVFCLLCTYEK